VSYDSELRRAADEFVTVVAVVAEARGTDPKALALDSLTDAVARLNEHGVLGGDDEPKEDDAA
jgi:hypothetical protein